MNHLWGSIHHHHDHKVHHHQVFVCHCHILVHEVHLQTVALLGEEDVAELGGVPEVGVVVGLGVVGGGRLRC